MKFIVGIDEAGRGPLAGPVTVGAFGASANLKKFLLKTLFNNKLRDSKKLSEKQRVAIYRYVSRLKKEGKVFFAVSHISNKTIDRIGINKSIQKGINQCLKKYEGAPCMIRLDGLLHAPPEFKDQKTIIKGDEKDVFIACASIVAKVKRDQLMCRMALKYPKYSLQIHKGYGTKLHRKLIRKHGLSDLHRRTFCSKI